MAGQRGLGTTFEFEKSGAEETNLVIGNLTSIGEEMCIRDRRSGLFQYNTDTKSRHEIRGTSRGRWSRTQV